MNLDQAIASLDPNLDDHWTSDGLPLMQVLVELTGDATLSRKVVTAAAPGLTRDTAPRLEPGPDEPAMGDDLEHHHDDGDSDYLAEDDDALGHDDHPGDPPPVPHVHVLSLPLSKVLASPDLTRQAIEVMSQRHTELVSEKREIEEEIRQVAVKAELLERAAVQHRRRAPDTTYRDTIGAYLETQKASRAQRVARAQRFIEAGTTAADVREQLASASKLDRAMSQRRPALGSKRPPPRPLIRG